MLCDFGKEPCGSIPARSAPSRNRRVAGSPDDPFRGATLPVNAKTCLLTDPMRVDGGRTGRLSFHTSMEANAVCLYRLLSDPLARPPNGSKPAAGPRRRRHLRYELAPRWEGEPPSARPRRARPGHAANPPGEAPPSVLAVSGRRPSLSPRKADRTNLQGLARLLRRAVAGGTRSPPRSAVSGRLPRTATPFETRFAIEPFARAIPATDVRACVDVRDGRGQRRFPSARRLSTPNPTAFDPAARRHQVFTKSKVDT